MKKLLPILLMIIAGSGFSLQAQEVITGLSENPVIKTEYLRLSTSGIQSERADEPIIPVNLPFFDDFTQTWIYPDENRWVDKEAYVNSNFGYHSVNWGVATLDAINSRGEIHRNGSQFPFIADSLTSRPIRMDSIFYPTPRPISISDSVYLSFFYQPQGRANQPESRDSLILQFGYYTGDSLFANYYDSIWVPVSQYIPENDTIFPGDTVYSPPECDNGLYVIASQYYYHQDLIQLPCDSVFIPEFRWKRIWSSEGMSLQEFHDLYGTYSRQVMIPITDSSKYFNKDFQFRFINWASLSSDFNASWKANCDQWNIDFVYLNINRKYSDTVYSRVTFAERAPSFLKNYEAMPYPQYVNNPTNEMKDNLEMTITNLDSSIYNSTYYYAVYQIDGAFEFLYPGGNCNLFPYNLNGYQNCTSCAAHACPPVNFIFPLSSTTDSAEFEVRHYIIGDITAQDTIADTISFRQKFFNYYAYDDGTPEEGYGLTPAGSKLAYRFRLNVKDTLRAVQMFFNRTQNNANEKMFDLKVWRDNNGKPGEEMYSQPSMLVAYSDNLLGFHTYMLDEPILVNGVFYIGWEQQTSDNLNLGYDRYNDAQQNIFYNSTGEWFQSTFQGALMMRPILGDRFEVMGTDEPVPGSDLITPYPNPLDGNLLKFKCTGRFQAEEDTRDLLISVYSILGEKVMESRFSQNINVSVMAPGLYIIRITNGWGNIISVAKLIKK